jgi:hypothetical protein
MEGLTPHEQWLAAGGPDRADFIISAIWLRNFAETHPGMPPLGKRLPLSFGMPPGSDEDKAKFVDAVAEWLEVPAAFTSDGTYETHRDIGMFRVEAHITPHAARMATVRRIFAHHQRRAA